ncbi:SurA-like protein [Halopolyspora algeriensis]|uniref:SurA-like protein n=1 Tax=Halopolyspora algeriensis TaxID=1500506 RepID=A0A368VFC2_9ACTN|nr:SurA N-terminal domain-containing protein [Halopolyspora algeriensis]RCW39971.1 SurA-like protein [Halopolyspora algeriensis]TQM46592.1 SurA-like protein [Halopolyspora algeriensis]
MSSVILRLTRVVVSVLAACLLLAGCGSSPGKVGTAAIVGDRAIPLTAVESRFNAVLDKESGLTEQLRQQGRMDDLARRIAGFAVREELARQAAHREELQVSEQEITERIERAGGAQAATKGTIFTARNYREVVRSQLLMTELGRRYLGRTSVTFDYTQATTRKEARAKAERMAQGPQQAAALIADDRAAGIPAESGKQVRAARNASLAVGTPLFGASPGTVLAFKGPNQRAGTWLIARVTERNANADPVPTGKVDEQTLQAFGTRLLGLTAERAGVQLSPRYGAWDPIMLSPAPEEGQKTGFRLAGHARPA